MKRSKSLALSLSALLMFTLFSCSSSEVKIGVIIPQEGDLADYGYQIRSGIQMAYEEVNAETASGNFKKTYTLVLEDEPSDPERLIEVFNKLEAEGVTAIIGAASSSGTLALTPLANEKGIVLLSPASSSPEINVESNDFVFRNYPSDTLEAQKLSNVIFQKCRIQKCLMVRAKTAFSEGITYSMLGFARQNSSRLPNEVIKFSSDSSTADWVATVDRIVEVNPDAVFLSAVKDGLIPLIREIRSRDELNDLYIFTHSSFLAEDVVKELGPEMVEGVMFSAYEWNPQENPRIQDFANKFTASYHANPTMYAATGYDAMWILAMAAEGVNHQMSEEFRAKISQTSFEEHVLFTTDFNKRGDVTRIPVVYRMTDGNPVELTEEDVETIKRDILTRI